MIKWKVNWNVIKKRKSRTTSILGDRLSTSKDTCSEVKMKIIDCQPSRKSSRKNQFIKRVNKSSLPQLLDGFPNDPWQSRFLDVHVVFADNLNAGTDFFFHLINTLFGLILIFLIYLISKDILRFKHLIK